MKLQLRIVLIGACVMIFSFIPELIPAFFGDWLCEGSGEYVSGSFHYAKCDHVDYYHYPTWHWGYRHFVWLLLGLILVITNIVQTINYYDKN